MTPSGPGMIITNEQKADIKNMSKLADSTLDTFFILLDFKKQKDAIFCLKRALECKMIALIKTKNIDFTQEKDILSAFENYFQETHYTDQESISLIRNIFVYSQKTIWLINDQDINSLLNNKNLKKISIFFRKCNQSLKNALKQKKTTEQNDNSINTEIIENKSENEVSKTIKSELNDNIEQVNLIEKNSVNNNKKKFYVIIFSVLISAIAFIGLLVIKKSEDGYSNIEVQIDITEKETGLVGTYYDSPKLSKNKFPSQILQRVDPVINFNWSQYPPDQKMPIENYSVSWTGFIQIDNSGLHSFFIQSDDGTRLWIDDNILIDDWNMHGVEERSINVNLTKGLHKIRIDYLQYGGNAVIKLLWRKPGGKKCLIPNVQLKPGFK